MVWVVSQIAIKTFLQYLDTRFKTVFFFYSKIKIKKDHLTLAEKERELKTDKRSLREDLLATLRLWSSL